MTNFSKLLLIVALLVAATKPAYAVMDESAKEQNISMFKRFSETAQISANELIDNSTTSVSTDDIHKHLCDSIAQNIIRNKEDIFWANGVYDGLIVDEVAKHVVGNEFLINVYYTNDGIFPEFYYDTKSFVQDTSQIFFNEQTSTIFEHYLGDNYYRFNPKLNSVTYRGGNPRYVSLEVIVKDAIEFEEILQHPLVEGAWHIGHLHIDSYPVK